MGRPVLGRPNPSIQEGLILEGQPFSFPIYGLIYPITCQALRPQPPHSSAFDTGSTRDYNTEKRHRKTSPKNVGCLGVRLCARKRSGGNRTLQGYIFMARVTDPEVGVSIAAEICEACGRILRPGRTFGFKTTVTAGGDGLAGAASELTKCLLCALRHWPMLKRSLMACLVVGTILTALNQGDIILSGQWNNSLYWKIPLTYSVPFMVATYGALINNRK